MKRLILLLLLICTMSASLPNQKIVLKTTLKQHWKTKIGCTSYRTIPVITDGKLLIGSNGSNFRDYSIDQANGVYMLNSKNGEVIKNFESKQFGDMDVNGVLNLNGLIYFGNDNEEFLCINQQGDVKWRVAAAGDIEHRPILLNSSGKQMIVFATETGQVQALDPLTGKLIWNYYNKKFSGWKLGENRPIFKIRMYFSQDYLYFNEPSLTDLNGDGVMDLVYNNSWGSFDAISGKTGKLLWEITRGDSDYYWSKMGKEKPLIIGKGSESKIMILHQSTAGEEFISFYNAKGKLINKVPSSATLGFALLSQTSDVFLTTQAIIKPSSKGNELKVIPIQFTYSKNQAGKLIKNEFGEGQVAANKINFNDESCAVVVYQGNPFSTLVLIGLNSGKIRYSTKLPAGSEFTPFISDFNKDGNLDVLIGCYDENLYCFDLGISASQLITN